MNSQSTQYPIPSDENANSLNKNSSHPKPPQKTIIKNLNNIFTFLSLSSDDIQNQSKNTNEYTNVVNDILKNNTTSFLEGKKGIIDMIITKHSKLKPKDFKNVKQLKLTIPKDFGMLNQIGYTLTNLEDLNLEGSEISTFSEIGASFHKLKKLNVSNCGLKDLSGVICFVELEELNASHNKINDLIDLEMCNRLRIIDLSDNDIESEDNLLYLNSLDKLEIVNLTNNPIANKMKDNNINNKINYYKNSNVKYIID